MQARKSSKPERVRLLSPSDIPAAMRLKEAAGWNQTEDDWRRLLALAPESCFGFECNGEIAATTTAICYGKELAWIGMVLTAPEYRGRGFARALMMHVMDFLRMRGVRRVKLDATEMGAGLYRSLGFEIECDVERWFRPAGPENFTPENHAGPLRFDPEFDHSAFGADRSVLMRLLRPLGGAEIPASGFAMWRRGAEAAYFGPCVARSAGPAGALLGDFLASHPNDPVFWDLPAPNQEAVRLAREHGFQCARRLKRMSFALQREIPALAMKMEQIYAIAGFEYG